MALLPVRLFGTTAADGSLTVLSEATYNGKLSAVQWLKGDFDEGVDAVFSVTGTDGGADLTLLTLTDANTNALYNVRHIVHSETGAALTGTSGGDRTMPLVVGRLKMVVAQGGNAKVSGAIVYLEVE
jgi:hypothetical protein